MLTIEKIQNYLNTMEVEIPISKTEKVKVLNIREGDHRLTIAPKVKEIICSQENYPFAIVKIENNKLCVVWEKHARIFDTFEQMIPKPNDEQVLNNHEKTLLTYKLTI